MADSTQYTLAVGRRKTASARVKLTPAPKTTLTVNGKPSLLYFKTKERDAVPMDVFKTLEETKNNYAIEARVQGGGIAAQATAVRHAIARAVIKAEEGTRPALKAAGLLTRDQRSKERKKPGLLKARKAPQWSKR
ncbi:MAG: 30S ribosomal protein S9 [Patescibacteria group bacterium]